VNDALADRLVNEFGLLSVAARACAGAAVDGQEQQVAYCVIALAGKADAPRSKRGAPAEQTYRMDLSAPDFSDRLHAWCAEVAKNLRVWGPEYEAIHDEADRYEITTLRRMVGAIRGDDIVEELATKLAGVLAGGPRLAEMSVALARDEGAAPNDYVFQRPLRSWVGTVVRRDRGLQADPLDAHEHMLRHDDDVDDEIAALQTAAQARLDLTIKAVAALGETRGLLTDAIARADAFEVRLARLEPGRREDRVLLDHIRAALLYEADWLQREQRALDNVLAYVTLAMRSAPQLQRVAILSLRLAQIDRRASEALADGMKRALVDTRHPTPVLVRWTRDAADDAAREVSAGLRRVAVVPMARCKALIEICERPALRSRAVAPVDGLLDCVPESVSDDLEIAAHERTSVTSVTTYRSNATAELTAVNAVFGRVFRRYARRSR
jgi:hypothetical protein